MRNSALEQIIVGFISNSAEYNGCSLNDRFGNEEEKRLHLILILKGLQLILN